MYHSSANNLISSFKENLLPKIKPLSAGLQEDNVAVADPGFPVGEVWTVGGGVDLQHGCFSPKMCAKTKELGPVGGHVLGTNPLDPPMR